MAAGELKSVREWITDGENGLLTDASDPNKLAESIVKALKSNDLRKQAAGLNAKRIADGAEYNACMSQASAFYQRVISKS